MEARLAVAAFMRQGRRIVRYRRMPSSVVRRFMYSPGTQELTIEFVTGRRYVYSEVSEDDVQAFRSAFSKGAHFNRYIRDGFPCREIASAGAD
jgi:hypothetical protein